MPELVIRAHALRKRYGDREVVRGVDLEVRAGEIFAFLGPNGAGKTTTVEMLEGYRPRDGGEVCVLGEDPARASRRWRQRIGVVLQSCTMPGELTVFELVDLYASYFPAPRPVGETIELAGLTDQRDVRAARLSGGQRRRLDVALALIGDPELVFLDEPTTGFDPSARHHAWKVIRSLSEIGTTIFLTTHYMEEAQVLADRVAVIADGTILAEGTPDALGGRDTAPTDIEFRPPPGIAPSGLPVALTQAAKLSNGRIRLQTEHPATTLYVLSRWALDHGFELDDLTVGRPTLEDVYLRLTQGRDARS